MLTVSFLLAVLVHGVIESLVGYGFVTGQKLWLILGFAAEALLAFLMASALVAVRDSSLEAALGQDEPEPPVEFADSEEFADFAEAEGSPVAALEGSGQQDLLEYADADTGPETGASDTAMEANASDTAVETGASDTVMETGASDTAMETGFSDTETGAGDQASSSGPWDKDAEAGNGSPYSPLEFGSADPEERTDDGLQSASGSGLLDTEDLQEPDDLSGPDDQNPPNDPVTTDPEFR
jgi:hypothetical protein